MQRTDLLAFSGVGLCSRPRIVIAGGGRANTSPLCWGLLVRLSKPQGEEGCMWSAQEPRVGPVAKKSSVVPENRAPDHALGPLSRLDIRDRVPQLVTLEYTIFTIRRFSSVPNHCGLIECH